MEPFRVPLSSDNHYRHHQLSTTGGGGEIKDKCRHWIIYEAGDI